MRELQNEARGRQIEECSLQNYGDADDGDDDGDDDDDDDDDGDGAEGDADIELLQRGRNGVSRFSGFLQSTSQVPDSKFSDSDSSSSALSFLEFEF